MQQIVAATALLFVFCCQPAHADPLTDKQILEVMRNLSATEYWSKGPLSLVTYCQKQYPDTAAASAQAFTEWVRSNVEYTHRVNAIQDFFIPLVARRMGKSDDGYNLHLTKMMDEVIVQKLEQGFDEGRRHEHCRDFPALLHAMFATDLIKPRVTIAVEALEALRAGR